MANRPVIYQLLPRLFGNPCPNPVPNGSLHRNGSGKLNHITPTVLKSLKDLGITHVWYTGVIEHSHDADYTAYGIERHNPHVVKGHAGSPYAITDYYDIDPDLAEDVPGRLREFDELVRRTHRHGLKAIIDFVPNHVARQYHSDAKPAGIEDFGQGDNKEMFFEPSNNFYYITRQQFAPHDVNLGSDNDAYVEFPARASGNDCFTAFPGNCDWYDTVKLNYGVDYGNGSHHFDPIPDTWLKMLHVLRYWAARRVDGFRCDMVHMVPLEFWQWAIANVKSHYPDVIFIAEIYDVGLYRPFIHAGGFDYLYDKVTLYDTLRAIECSNVSAATLTSCWQTVEGIAGNMLTFLENHDEQRFASDFFCGDPDRVRAAMTVSATMNTGAVMIYNGQELGERGMDAEGYSGCDGRTTIFDYWSMATVRNWLNGGSCDGQLDWRIEQLRGFYGHLFKLINKEKALREGRFFDLMYVNYDNPALDPHRDYAFLRTSADETLLIVANFGDFDKEVQVRVPAHAFDVLDIPQGTVRATELLSGEKQQKNLMPDQPFITRVPAHGAVIWKMVNSRIRDPHVPKTKPAKA